MMEQNARQQGGSSRLRWSLALGVVALGVLGGGIGLYGSGVLDPASLLGEDEASEAGGGERESAAGGAVFGASELDIVEASSTKELLAKLRERGSESWPPEEEVAPVTARGFPKDLGEVRVELRKEAFFRVLTPVVLAENARLRQARSFVKEVAPRLDRLEPEEEARLRELAKRYRVSRDSDDFAEQLLRRVDEVPVAMALAQAANESAWGTSRFAREANNLFGEWTWTQKEGLVPKRRGEGQTHRIRTFPSVQQSVRAYAYNLNVGGAYKHFRELRAQLREAGKPLDGHRLSAGLVNYSERGKAYVEEVRSMIQFNGLGRLREMELGDGSG